MASEPWFKFYAKDYLFDDGVDALPLEAQAILVRMWCVCHLSGSCPGEPDEIARKTCLPTAMVSKHREQLSRFFESRDGRLYSRRMDVEKQKSDIARRNGQKRGEQIRSANRLADGSADCLAQSQSQSQSQIQNQEQGQNQKQHPSTEIPVFHSKEKQQFSQKDFDARDLRKFNDAGRKLAFKLQNNWGQGLTQEQIFVEQCIEAGVPPDQMREVFARIDASEASA